MIIDSHAHVIEHLSGMGARGEVRPIGDGRVRFLDGEEMQVIPGEIGGVGFSAEQLLEQMEQAHIDRAVLLHGLLYGLQNDYIYECVAKYPDRFKGSGSFDPCIDQAELVLNRLIYHYGYRILKFELSTGAGMMGLHPDLKIDGEEFERIYAEAERHGVTIVFDIGSRGMKSFQVEELVRAAGRHPEVKFTLCHLMAPNGADFEAWRQDMKRLTARENIWFDLTAVPWNIHETYPYPVSLRYVAEAVKLVGTGRLLWGSDVPTLLNLDSYGNLYQYLIDGKICTADGLDDLLYRTSQIVYGK